MTSITIPSSVTSIGSKTFYGCTALKKVNSEEDGVCNIPNTVTSIGESAFSGCNGLTSVIIPSSVTSIGERAFDVCGGLTSVTFEEGVSTIGDFAFNSCTNLTDVSIPSSITMIGASTFKSCTNLNYNIDGYVKYLGNSNNAYCALMELSSKDEASYTINENTKVIANSAFSECTNLTSITIPSNTTTIGNSAFYKCSALTSVTISEGVKTIGNSAFYNCSALTSVTIPSSVTTIGNSAFKSCHALTSVTISEGVVTIGPNAFESCYPLTSVIIPSIVTTIGDDAFLSCYNLTDVFAESGLDVSNASIQNKEFPPYRANIWRYEVLADQTGAPEGKTLVNIVSVAKSAETTDPLPTSIACGAMGDRYFMDSIEANGVTLTHTMTEHAAVPATCTTTGSLAYWSCSECGKYFSDAQGETEIEANSGATSIDENAHSWNETIYRWIQENGNWKCTATRTCANDNSHVEIETATATGEEEISATCETAGTTLYTAEFENAAFVTQTKEENDILATGHSWSQPTYEWSNDNTTCTAKRVCENDNSHVETETVNTTSAQILAATCEGKGVTSYTATFTNTNFLTQTKIVITSATGHNCDNTTTYTWSNDNSLCVAERTCNVCHEKEHEVAIATSTQTTAATCGMAGTTLYIAEFENTVFATQTKEENDIPAIGHSWSQPMYEWSNDNATCTATRVCANDNSHVETESATITSAIKVPATCTDTGTKVYIAGFKNGAFSTQTKDETIETKEHSLIAHLAVAATCTEVGNSGYWECENCHKYFSDAQGVIEISENSWEIPISEDMHVWEEVSYTWAEDNTTCTATRVCANDDSHVETESATIASAIKVPATCTDTGTKVYIASFENGTFSTQTKDETIEAKGHTWSYEWNVGDGKHWHECTVCHDAKEDEEAHALVHEERLETTLKEDGHVEGYTCSVCDKHFSDGQGINEISEADWIISKLNYDMNNDGNINILDIQMLFNLLVANAV